MFGTKTVPARLVNVEKKREKLGDHQTTWGFISGGQSTQLHYLSQSLDTPGQILQAYFNTSESCSVQFLSEFKYLFLKNTCIQKYICQRIDMDPLLSCDIINTILFI